MLNASTTRAGTVTVSLCYTSTYLLFNCNTVLMGNAFVGRTFRPPVRLSILARSTFSLQSLRPIHVSEARSACRSEPFMSTNVIFRPIQLRRQYSSSAPCSKIYSDSPI